MVDPNRNWRNDGNLSMRIEYKRKWAIFPVVLNTGEKLWATPYYTKYEIWGNGGPFDSMGSYGHTDKIENITEAEYIVRKLAENL